MIQFKPGDIGFLMHTDNWLSKAIAWFMQSQWSHSFVILEHTETACYIVETSDLQVVIADMNRYLTDPNVRLALYTRTQRVNSEIDKVKAQALPLVNKIYGHFQLLSLGVRRLLMRVGIYIKNFIRWGLVCCAVPMYAYKGTGVPGLTDLDPEDLDTEELFQIVHNSPHFVLSYSQDP